MSAPLTDKCLAEAADLLDTNGWNPRGGWRKTPDAGMSIMEAIRIAAAGHRVDVGTLCQEIRRRLDPIGRTSIADFEDAPTRRPSEIIALLNKA